MAEDALRAAIDRLHAVPLDEFVAERTRLAKELKGGGDADAAAQLAKLPKPTAAAWALNHVAREDPAAVEEWLEAAAGLRDASTHAAEVGGDALREAMTTHRDATRRLTDVVRDRAQPGGRALSEAMLERVRALLQSATADERLAELLREGRVTEEKLPPELTLEPAPPRRRTAAAAPARRPAAKRDREAEARRERDAEERAKRRAELERRVTAAEGEVQRLQQEAARLEDAAEIADERLQEARRTLHRSESEAAAAHDAVKDAVKAAASAERDLKQLRARLGSR